MKARLLTTVITKIALTLCLLLANGCTGSTDPNAVPEVALASFSQEELAQDIKTLASDEFEGRGPSTPGEEKTVNFLVERFKSLGLQPGNGASFFQQVPLVTSRQIPTC